MNPALSIPPPSRWLARRAGPAPLARRLPLIAGLVTTILGGAAPAQTERDLRDLLRLHFGDRHAGVVLVERGGKQLVLEAHGLLRPRGAKVTGKTLFDLGTASEAFTAVAVLRAVQAGKLGLDDPIQNHLKYVPVPWRELTVRNLLDRTAGLAPAIEWSPDRRGDSGSFVAAVLAEPSTGRPGRQARPSALDYGVLAAMLENVGQPLATSLHELFATIGLPDTALHDDDGLDPKRALQRFQPGRDPAPVGDATTGKYDWEAIGRGGIVTTVPDLAKFYRALHGTAVLDAATGSVLWGRGWGQIGRFELTRNDDKLQRVLLAGTAHGFEALLLHLVETDHLIVALAGAGTDLAQLGDRIERLLRDGKPEAAAAGQHRVGRFRVKADEEFDLAVEGGQLVLRALGQESCARLVHGIPRMPEWPKFYEECNARLDVLVRPLLLQDHASSSRSFHKDAPADAASSAQQLIADLVAAHGRCGEVRTIGTSAAVGQVSYLRVTFGTTPVTLVVEWHGEELKRVARHPTDWPFAVVLTAAGVDQYTAMSLDGKAKLKVVVAAGGKRLEVASDKDSVRAQRVR
ncbi:MAG: beta-lactamase family protein [Planctomycetes bacterium]|nr:beta-lactamase family protein [Planctomycetota bacterium]